MTFSCFQSQLRGKGGFARMNAGTQRLKVCFARMNDGYPRMNQVLTRVNDG